MLGKLNFYVTRVSVFLIPVALIVGMAGFDGVGGGHILPPSQHSPPRNLEIRTWYDLDAIRNNLAGNHTLMNDLDSTTPLYEELASETANQGEGWQPIGFVAVVWWDDLCGGGGRREDWYGLTGTFDGQGYEIRDLFIDRPHESDIGLFGVVDEGGVIKDVGAVNVTVIGEYYIGGLVGRNRGTVNNSYSSGNVTGEQWGVGGLVGVNSGTVSNSYSTCNVIGNGAIGGLAGHNDFTVSNSYSTGDVTGSYDIGGLVGVSYGTVSNSYSSVSVTGYRGVGGLVGTIVSGRGTVSNSYSSGSVTGATDVGGLVGKNYEGTVSNSFWDVQTSGQTTSAGGTGKTTAKMKNSATFSGAGWNIIGVAPGVTNSEYTWNIVDGQAYPFLSWQPVS